MAVKIVETDNVAPEVLAAAIIEMAAGVSKLLSGPLKRKTLVLLIQNSCQVEGRPTQQTVNTILDAIEGLADRWVKDKF